MLIKPKQLKGKVISNAFFNLDERYSDIDVLVLEFTDKSKLTIEIDGSYPTWDASAKNEYRRELILSLKVYTS